MDTLRKLQRAIKKFLGLVIPPAEPEPRPQPPAPHFSFTAPAGMPEPDAKKLAETVRIELEKKTGMPEPDAKKLAETVRIELEKKTGKPMQVVCLGLVKLPPCKCPACQAIAQAPWN